MLKHQTPVGENAAMLAEAFCEFTPHAINSGDQDEVFNASVAFAEKRGITAATMGVVLSVLYQRRQVALTLLQSWLREGSDALGQTKVPGAADSFVNSQIQEHASQAEWEFAQLAGELTSWYARFNGEFYAASLPPAAISIARSRVTTLGWYLPARDGLGLRFRINLNRLHVHKPRAQVLGVLLHETVHLWEDVVHHRRRGGNYHTALFREKAEEFGIPTNAQGHWSGIDPEGRFASLLRRHGVTLDEKTTARPVEPAASRGSSLVKWSCGCTNLWSARGTKVQADCKSCSKNFVRWAG